MNQRPSNRRSATSLLHLGQAAKRRAGITKSGGIHALRHVATHQLEAGMPIHRLQLLLGHHGIGTTMRYIHLAQPSSYLIEGAADLLAPFAQPVSS